MHLGEEIRAELRERLAQLERAGLARTLELASEQHADFASNDYLGLSRHPAVVAAGCAALAAHGAGARASRLLGGGAPEDREAERRMAEWIGQQDALLFSSGFQANLGALTTLVQPGDAVLSDELNHASLIDAVRLTKAQRLIFPHEDLAALERRLREARSARRRWVVTEGVFSMEGGRASLVELSRLCARHDAWLIVDEAHSIGVVGAEGAGAWAEARERGADESRLAALTIPCGKALGVAGGFVSGSVELRQLLASAARSFVFSTGAAPAISGALCASIGLARAAEAERAHLQRLGEALADELGCAPTLSAITPIVVGDNALAVELARRATEQGFDVRAVRPPTVPQGTARLRVALHAGNREEDVRRLGALLAPHRRPADHERAPAHRPLFVVGTDTGIGKTVVSALLTRAAAAVGKATYWKPVQTGDDSDTETVRSLSSGLGARFAEPSFAFALPASPHEAAAAEQAVVHTHLLDARLAQLVAEPGELIVELAGGLLVPYDDVETQADLLARVKPRIVLVARSGLGTLNHTMLTLEALRRRGLEPEALVLVGDEHPSNRETLRSMGRVPIIHELPQLEDVSADGLADWLDSNDLSYLFTT